jgi:hypothetical protein
VYNGIKHVAGRGRREGGRGVEVPGDAPSRRTKVIESSMSLSATRIGKTTAKGICMIARPDASDFSDKSRTPNDVPIEKSGA